MKKQKYTIGLLLAFMLLLMCPIVASASASTNDTTSEQEEMPSYRRAIWRLRNGVKYCYDNDNKRITGWAKVANKIYYFDRTGAMATGLTTVEKNLYYFEPTNYNGMMKTGWVTVDGDRYYFDKSTGAAKTGRFTIGKKTYYAHRKTHKLLLNQWRKTGSKYYYFNKKGVQYSGWFKMGGKTYYCHLKRGKLSGWKVIDKEVYYFNKEGYIETSQWISHGSQLWFVDSTGVVVQKRSKTAQYSSDYGQIFMVGDSRFERTEKQFGITADNVTYVCKAGQGYYWFRDEGYELLTQAVNTYVEDATENGGNTKIAIVFNLGANDLTNIKRYLNIMNNRVTSFAQTCNSDLYYVSVNPIYEKNPAKVKNKARNNAKIDTFNKKLKNGLNSKFNYVDINSWMKKNIDMSSAMLDNVHYTEDASRAIFDRIMLYVRPRS